MAETISEALRRRFEAELPKHGSARERQEWLDANRDMECTACYADGFECVPQANNYPRCATCVTRFYNRGKKSRCSRLEAERRFRITRKLGITDSVYDALYKQVEGEDAIDCEPPSSSSDSLPLKIRLKNVSSPPAAACVSSASLENPSPPLPQPRLPKLAEIAPTRKRGRPRKHRRHNEDSQVIAKLEEENENLRRQLESQSNLNAQNRVAEVLKGVLLHGMVSQILAQTDAPSVLERFRQLPSMLKRDTEWRVEGLEYLGFEDIGLESLHRIIAGHETGKNQQAEKSEPEAKEEELSMAETVADAFNTVQDDSEDDYDSGRSKRHKRR